MKNTEMLFWENLLRNIQLGDYHFTFVKLCSNEDQNSSIDCSFGEYDSDAFWNDFYSAKKLLVLVSL